MPQPPASGPSLATPLLALATPIPPATPPAARVQTTSFPMTVAQTTPLAPLIPPDPGVQSHDSQVIQFPILPAPPMPHLSMDSYPSTHQDTQSGRPNPAGHSGNRSGIGRGSTAGSGKGFHKTGIGHAGSGMGCGVGVNLEEGLFDSAGLSTEERVAAYLAAESAEGYAGERGVANTEKRGVAGSGGKRSATDAASEVKPKKRKRI